MLNSDAWHVRLYLWTILGWKHLFTSCSEFKSTKNLHDDDRCWTETNTCTYLRTLLLWCPLLHLIYAGLILGPFIAVFEPLIRFYGFAGLWNLSVFAAIAVTVPVTLFFIFKYIGRFLGRFLGYLFTKTSNAIYTAYEECHTPEVGFCAMIWKCIKDWHAQVCTVYKINDGSQS